MNNYYVYMYHNSAGIPYYIGKGKAGRITQHLTSARSGKKYPLADKIRSLWKNNTQPLFQKVATGLTEKSAYALEESLILFYKRRIDGGVLLNLAIGGPSSQSGLSPPNKGVALTPEAKLNISNKLKLYYSTHVSHRKGMPSAALWTNKRSNKAAWVNLDLFYRYYLLGLGKRTLSKIFNEISPTVFSTIIDYFKKHGNPLNDQLWLEYKASEEPYDLVENPYNLKPFYDFYEGFKQSEIIYELVKQGKGVKSIRKQLDLPYGAVATIVRDVKLGWIPANDEMYTFAKARSQELLIKQSQQNKGTQCNEN